MKRNKTIRPNVSGSTPKITPPSGGSNVTSTKLDCGVHSLPEWMREMIAERMSRLLKEDDNV